MIWKHLGFTRNIFFVEPLGPDKDDIELFVGRDDEIKKYLVDVLSDTRALKIVSGDVGVGKTTFVNACQYFAYTGQLPFEFRFPVPKVLPCFEKIQIRESDTLDDFLNQAITSICQSIVHHCRLTQQDPPRPVKETLSHFLDLAIGSGGAGVAGGISIVGTGAHIGKTTESKMPNPIRNARVHLKKLVTLVKNELKFQGVFITVNNLDILPKRKLIDFVNTGRDELFDIKGIYWTLIGRKGIRSIIETEAERVADYLSGAELNIGPLDYRSTEQIIERRVQSFRRTDSARCPLTDETILAFHMLSVQELRETLSICGEITRRVLVIDPSHDVIPTSTAMLAFMQYAHERARDLDITESKKRVLVAVFDSQTCRPKDYQRFGYNSVQGFIAALKALVAKRLLSVEERGRARIYRMTGMTMMAAVTSALGPDIEKAATQHLKGGKATYYRQTDGIETAQLELQLDDQNST